MFQELAQRGRWFFGFKLLPINHHGQAIAYKITGGNTDARQPLEPMGAAPGSGLII